MVLAANCSELGRREYTPKSDRIADDVNIDTRHTGGYKGYAKRVSHRAGSTCGVSMQSCSFDLMTEVFDRILQSDVTKCRVKISHGWFRRFIRREDDQGDIVNMSKAIDDAITQSLVRPNENVLLYSTSILKELSYS